MSEVMERRKKYFLALALFAAVLTTGCNRFHNLQRTQIVSVFHLIEAKRFTEAKGVVEEMVVDEKIAQWPRIWYARGVLAQSAFREGMRTNDARQLNLYPNQLEVVYESFQKAVHLDSSPAMQKRLNSRFVQLANDFALYGERHFSRRNFSQALTAFERALFITENHITPSIIDTALIHNAGLAALEARNWTAASQHYGRLHGLSHSPSVTHQLAQVHILAGDTLNAERVLLEGLSKSPTDYLLMTSITDLYLARQNAAGALALLQHALTEKPDGVVFYNLKGFVYQRMGENMKAIGAFQRVVQLDSLQWGAYVNIATCYYNLGVEIENATRAINQIHLVRRERERVSEAFSSAIWWLDQVYATNTRDQGLIQSMLQLYRLLRIPERVLSLEQKVR